VTSTERPSGMDEVDAALAELRADFIASSLPTRVRALEAFVAEAIRSPALREPARRAAHMLRGTAGSLHLTALSDALAPLEIALKEGPSHEGWAKLEVNLALVLRLAAAARGGA
jgi:HPt (histidine-containing phosphotransfer) domain-containing protein